MDSFDRAAVSPAGTGTLATGFGPHLIRITAAQTGGRLGVFEAEIPAGEGPPFHIHEREEETFRVLSGRFAFWCGANRVELDEGGLIVVPRGTVHRFQNVGDGFGRLMTMMTPGGFEGFFAAVGEAGAARPAELDRIAAGFHLRFVPLLADAMVA